MEHGTLPGTISLTFLILFWIDGFISAALFHWLLLIIQADRSRELKPATLLMILWCRCIRTATNTKFPITSVWMYRSPLEMYSGRSMIRWFFQCIIFLAGTTPTQFSTSGRNPRISSQAHISCPCWALSYHHWRTILNFSDYDEGRQDISYDFFPDRDYQWMFDAHQQSGRSTRRATGCVRPG